MLEQCDRYKFTELRQKEVKDFVDSGGISALKDSFRNSAASLTDLLSWFTRIASLRLHVVAIRPHLLELEEIVLSRAIEVWL